MTFGFSVAAAAVGLDRVIGFDVDDDNSDPTAGAGAVVDTFDKNTTFEFSVAVTFVGKNSSIFSWISIFEPFLINTLMKLSGMSGRCLKPSVNTESPEILKRIYHYHYLCRDILSKQKIF